MVKLILLIAAVFVASTTALQMKIPSFAYTGESVEMKCNIAMPFMVKSITWLKDGKEFYSYSNDSPTPISMTAMDGVTVNMKKSSMYGNAITLDSVDPTTSGMYTCKMELEHPSFDVAEMSATLKVVALPTAFETSYEGYKYMF